MSMYSDEYDQLIRYLRGILDSDDHYWPVNSYDEKPFDVIFQPDDPELERLMSERGIDASKYFCKPLHSLIDDPNIEFLEFFLSTRYSDPLQQDAKVWAALCYAVACNNIKAVELMLKSGANVNASDHSRRTPLHCVNYDGDEATKIIELLLSHGADGDAIGDQKRSALSYAAASKYNSRHTERLKLFFDHGAGRKPDDSCEEYRPFKLVVSRGDLDGVKLFFSYGVDPILYAPQFPLHVAITGPRGPYDIPSPRLENLEFLISTGHYDPNQIDDMGVTALYHAVHANSFKAVELLLNYGADPNLKTGDDRVSLHYIRYENPSDELTKIIEILLQHGADADSRDGRDMSPLYHAAYSGFKDNSAYSERLELFLRHLTENCKFGNTLHKPFEAVLQHGNRQSVQLFIDYGIDLNNCDQESLFCKAFKNPDIGVLEILLATGKLNLEWRNEIGETVLHQAARAAKSEAMELLLDWGVDVNSVSQNGETALTIVAERITFKGSRSSEALLRCIELLFAQGAKMNLSESNGGDHLFRSVSLAYLRNRFDAKKILMQVNLLQSKGQNVNPLYFTIRESENKQCQDELEVLKVEKLEGLLSLYDVLVNGYEGFYSDKLMQKLQDQEYIRTLRSRFTIYGDRLTNIIRHLSLKDAAAMKLSQLIKLPRDSFYMVIDRIVRLLPRQTLRALLNVEVEF